MIHIICVSQAEVCRDLWGEPLGLQPRGGGRRRLRWDWESHQGQDRQKKLEMYSWRKLCPKVCCLIMYPNMPRPPFIYFMYFSGSTIKIILYIHTVTKNVSLWDYLQYCIFPIGVPLSQGAPLLNALISGLYLSRHFILVEIIFTIHSETKFTKLMSKEGEDQRPYVCFIQSAANLVQLFI